MITKQVMLLAFAAATAGIVGIVGIVGIDGATAQVYPSRPITMIVPFTAGGPTDVVARILSERMRVSLGQTILIENVAGASGSLGVGRAARAAGDGYTLSIGTLSTHVLNGAVYTLQYDLLRDFQPVALLAAEPLLIVGKKAMPATSLKELIAWLKANPDRASQGHPGAGTVMHIAGVAFQRKTGTHFQSVPYRGNAQAMQDLVAGQIDLMIDPASNSLPQLRAGQIKVFAAAAEARLASAPDIPTTDEAGLPGFHASVWYGLWVPARTPKEIIAKLNAAATDALADPSVRSRLAELGQEIAPREQQTPEALGAHQKAETERWWPIVKAAGIRAE